MKLNDLENAKTQQELTDLINSAKLSAGKWKQLAKESICRSYPSGRQARQALHQKYSDNLLIANRVKRIKAQFTN